jgi:uncharacterized protein YciU (UPF0263 family)
MHPGRSKYAITVEGKDIPEDEPLFLLRSQDRLAPAAVLAYAAQLEERGMEDQAEDVRMFASRMSRWQLDNPDKVKLPD